MTQEYEKIPERVQAFTAPIDMAIAQGDDRTIYVDKGQWVVTQNGTVVDVLSDADFVKKYRTPVVPCPPNMGSVLQGIQQRPRCPDNLRGGLPLGVNNA